MPSRPADHGIPTLTQRAEPSLYPPSAEDDADAPLLTELADDTAAAHDDDAFPLLTDLADSSDTSLDTAILETPVPASRAGLPDATVLSARLQAEVEQLMREALAQAIEQIQARMDAELPRIVARVLQDVRPG
ncbi:hypothetical protein AXYL_01567 [Achromobacter xylosoxidans A8]|uniref:Uncharacterized protein n=1 Tax=Achromobacter xylosoxidans (strain A8) TaxID=762376 RepID=E3HTE2_ACHXA|nr:hypothetical protein [Achromobacter xylosoxidans]ADP14905.1 hypothetical protein AXYL_01567 [Achromobacter xylosoxidans A8]